MASAEPTGRKRVLVFAGTAAALFLIGALLITTAGDPPREAERAVEEETSATSEPVAPASPVPAGENAGMPTGFAAGEHGAAVAGVSYATASQRWLYFTDDEIRAAIAEIATPVAAPRMADEIVLEVSTAREQLGDWWIEPLAAATYCYYIVAAFMPGTLDGVLGHTWSLTVEEQFYLL